MSAPDISREAVERMAEDFDTMRCYHNGKGPEAAWYENAAVTLRALRDALDAAERERDELRAAKWQVRHTDTANTMVQLALARDEAFAERDAADATGYARGVRDAADQIKRLSVQRMGCVTRTYKDCSAAILALLPATTETKETRDDQ